MRTVLTDVKHRSCYRHFTRSYLSRIEVYQCHLRYHSNKFRAHASHVLLIAFACHRLRSTAHLFVCFNIIMLRQHHQGVERLLVEPAICTWI